MKNYDVLLLVCNKDHMNKVEEKVYNLLIDNNVSFHIEAINDLYGDKDINAKAVIAGPYKYDAAIGYLAARFEDALIVVGDNQYDSTAYVVVATGGVIYHEHKGMAEHLMNRIFMLTTGVQKNPLDRLVPKYPAPDYNIPRFRGHGVISTLENKC